MIIELIVDIGYFFQILLEGVCGMANNYERFVKFMGEMIEKYGRDVLEDLKEEDVCEEDE